MQTSSALHHLNSGQLWSIQALNILPTISYKHIPQALSYPARDSSSGSIGTAFFAIAKQYFGKTLCARTSVHSPIGARHNLWNIGYELVFQLCEHPFFRRRLSRVAPGSTQGRRRESRFFGSVFRGVVRPASWLSITRETRLGSNFFRGHLFHDFWRGWKYFLISDFLQSKGPHVATRAFNRRSSSS